MEQKIFDEFDKINKSLGDVKEEFHGEFSKINNSVSVFKGEVHEEFNKVNNDLSLFKEEVQGKFNRVDYRLDRVEIEALTLRVDMNKKFDIHEEAIRTNTASIVNLEARVVDGNRMLKDIWSLVVGKPSKDELPKKI